MQPMKRLLTVVPWTLICFHALGQLTDQKYRDNYVNGLKPRDPDTVEKVFGKAKTTWTQMMMRQRFLMVTESNYG